MKQTESTPGVVVESLIVTVRLRVHISNLGHLLSGNKEPCVLFTSFRMFEIHKDKVDKCYLGKGQGKVR